MGKVEANGTTLVTSRDIRLGYTAEFRDLLHQYPGILRTVAQITEGAEKSYNPGNFEVGPYFTVAWSSELDNLLKNIF